MAASSAAGRITRGLSVSDVMTSEVVTLDVNDSLHIADDVMVLGRIRHMPVVDADGGLEGILSQRDLFKGALARALGYGEHAQQKLYDILRVKDVMTVEVMTVPPDAPLVEAARMMTDRKIGCVVVVEKGRVAGILTETDIVRLVHAENGFGHSE